MYAVGVPALATTRSWPTDHPLLVLAVKLLEPVPIDTEVVLVPASEAAAAVRRSV